MADRIAQLPHLGAPAADAHAHLDMLEDPATALVHAALAGIDLIATVVDLTESPEATLDGLDIWRRDATERLEAFGRPELAAPEVRIVLGTHPHNASHHTPALGTRLRESVRDPRVGAIGEVGLDFHYDNSPRDAQRAMFRDHLQIAREAGLPVIVHLREAHEEGAATLAEVGIPDAGCVIHCFTEGVEWAERFLSMGCLISFSGLATFKKAEAIREAVDVVPLDRLLVETDCPFLAPEPFRGTRNEPALTVLVAEKVAEVKCVATEEVARVTRENAARLFGSVGGAVR